MLALRYWILIFTLFLSSLAQANCDGVFFLQVANSGEGLLDIHAGSGGGARGSLMSSPIQGPCSDENLSFIRFYVDSLGRPQSQTYVSLAHTGVYGVATATDQFGRVIQFNWMASREGLFGCDVQFDFNVSDIQRASYKQLRAECEYPKVSFGRRINDLEFHFVGKVYEQIEGKMTTTKFPGLWKWTAARLSKEKK